MAAEHSPTPWRVVELTLYNPGNERTIFAAGSTFSLASVRWSMHYGVDGETRDANAEYIVRCVNSHEALVQALESCIGECERLCIGNVDAMRAALKLAEATHV